jgi:signal transduction histidine kinase
MQKGAKVRSSLASAPRRVLVGFVAAILTLVIVSAATLYGLSRRTADGESVRNTFSVLRTTEELTSAVSRILGAAHRMESMIRDLLDYSRLELKLSLPLDVRPSNVHDSALASSRNFAR